MRGGDVAPLTPAPYLVLDYDPWSGGGALGVAVYATLEEARAAARADGQADVWEWQDDGNGGHYVNLDG